MRNLTKEEALKRYEECLDFIEMYHSDGTPKLMPVGFRDTSLHKVCKTLDKVDITDEYANEHPEFIETCIKWINEIKYMFLISSLFTPNVQICIPEVERLADMLGGKGDRWEFIFDDRNFRIDVKWVKKHYEFEYGTQECLININTRDGDRLNCWFKTTIVFDEVRKHWELSKEIDGLLGFLRRLK